MATGTARTRRRGRPARPRELLDREREWDTLGELFASPGPELCFVVGRRRAGKSFLLTRFVRACGAGVYYQATRKTERDQLRAVSRALGEQAGDPALRRASLPDWEAVFRYVVERAGDRPFLLVLDEFPYLAQAAPALTSVIQALWDHELAATRLKLVLSGSHITAMRRLEAEDQPLFGRRTRLVRVGPFDYFDAARFFPRLEPRDRLRMYAVFGGLPGHLALIDPARSVAENACRQVLSESGRLFDEAAHVFDAFLADASVHYSIVQAIAGGEHRWSRIASRIGKTAASVARPLDWLVEMEIVERVVPITEDAHPSPKRTLYRVTDPYLRFWHAFVADLRARGVFPASDPAAVWRTAIAPRLDGLMGLVFEEACRAFVRRAEHPRLPFRPVRVGSWWARDGSGEVDIVALGEDGQVLVGECKWGGAGVAEIQTLRQRAELVLPRLRGVRRVHHAIFTADGLSGPAREAARSGAILHFGLADLYHGLPGARPARQRRRPVRRTSSDT